jgi:hypothetical protein
VNLPVVDRSALGASAEAVAAVGPLGFRVAERAFTYRLGADGVERIDGLDEAAAVVALSEAAWDHFASQTRTFINLFLAGALTFERGHFEHLAEWDPCSSSSMRGSRSTTPPRGSLRVDLRRVFTLESSDAELRGFLDIAGFLHLGGVFTRRGDGGARRGGSTAWPPSRGQRDDRSGGRRTRRAPRCCAG